MARLVSLDLDAALLEGALSKSTRRVTCREAADAASVLARAAAGAPDLVVLGGDAQRAADAAEALTDEAALLGTPLVAWRIHGTLSDTSRLLALGVRIATGDEDELRRICEEALDAREGRTMRVDPPTEVQSARADLLDLHGRRVVVADDDPAITWFFADLLRAEGCDVRESPDGDAALDAARRTAPDLVISDIRMPRMDGVRLCRALRADPILADVPVILLSWKDDWLRDAQDLGVEASAFLQKRSSPEEIVAGVREVMASHLRLEQRMRVAGPVRGRLDGTAPYRLLRLACASRPDARLTVRCHPHAYELHVRDGAPLAATRVSPDGEVLRGPPVLASLLSERSGRFTLSAEHAPVEGELTGSLHQQLAGHIARFRRGGPLVVQPPVQIVPPSAPASASPSAPATASALASASAPAPAPVPALAPAPTLVQAGPAAAQAPWLIPPPEAIARTVPLGPRHVADHTAPLARPAPSRKHDVVPAPPPPSPRRLRGIPLRWVSVAAVAALGILLGAGARMLRQATEAPPAAQAPALTQR
jgi:CheY-like chemotaxis protein